MRFILEKDKLKNHEYAYILKYIVDLKNQSQKEKVVTEYVK